LSITSIFTPGEVVTNHTHAKIKIKGQLFQKMGRNKHTDGHDLFHYLYRERIGKHSL